LFCLLAKLLNSGKIVEINNIEDALCSWHREVHLHLLIIGIILLIHLYFL